MRPGLTVQQHRELRAEDESDQPALPVDHREPVMRVSRRFNSCSPNSAYFARIMPNMPNDAN